MQKYKYKGQEYSSLFALRRDHHLSISGSASPDFLTTLGIEIVQIEYQQLPIQPDELRAQKLDNLNTQCNELLEQKLSSYPPHERSTFDRQVREAVSALAGDEKENYALINALAQARALPVEELAKRILEKHREYTDYAGNIIGKKQRLKDMLVDAETVEAIEMLDIAL